MIDSRRKEELSYCFLNALCAYMGISCEMQRHDDDSMDCLVKKAIDLGSGEFVDVNVTVQLKATSQILRENEEYISYPLEVKNYNDLRRPSTNHKLLCVFIMPNNEGDWVTHTFEELIVRRSMYWMSFEDAPKTDNEEKITVKIPKANFVTSEVLLSLLEQYAREVFE